MHPPPISLLTGWLVTILASHQALADVRYNSPIIGDLKLQLGERYPTITVDPDGILVTLYSYADPTEAAEDAEAALEAALAECSIYQPTLKSQRLTREDDVNAVLDKEDSLSEIADYYSLAEVARGLGVSRQRAWAMNQNGLLPNPVCKVGDSLGFNKLDIHRFIEARSEC